MARWLMTFVVALALALSGWACDDGESDGDADADARSDSGPDGDADADADESEDADEGGDAEADGPCEPECRVRECGDDGCGGNCGACGAGERCNETTGQCVPSWG